MKYCTNRPANLNFHESFRLLRRLDRILKNDFKNNAKGSVSNVFKPIYFIIFLIFISQCPPLFMCLGGQTHSYRHFQKIFGPWLAYDIYLTNAPSLCPPDNK